MTTGTTGEGDKAVTLLENVESTEEGIVPGDLKGESELIALVAHNDNPVVVKRKNKIICTTAYVILILWMMIYVAGLAVLSVYHKEVSNLSYFSGPINVIYVVVGTDIIASAIGIVTCLAKTGPKPMIFTCIWLLLTSLADLGSTISLTIEGKLVKEARQEACTPSPVTENCKAYTRLKVVIWCSSISILFKVIVLILCRLNYPQVFNWMVGKHVYVDEELVNKVDAAHLTVGGGMFDTCDIARLSARGSAGGEVKKLRDQKTYVVLKKSDASDASDETVIPKRRSTLVSLTSNTSSMILKLTTTSGSGQIM